MSKLCGAKHPDLALLGYVSKTESGNAMLGAVTGRAELKQDWVMNVLSCRSKATYSFGGTLQFDGGVMNQKTSTEFNEMIGAELGGKILAAIGK